MNKLKMQREINKLREENWNLRYGHNEFTWSYIHEGKEVILEDLVQKYPDDWNEALLASINFFDKACFYDIIVEASDEFEELLQTNNIDLRFIEQTEDPCDYNILIGNFLRR